MLKPKPQGGQRDGAMEVHVERKNRSSIKHRILYIFVFNHFNEGCGHSPNSVDALLSSTFCIKQYH